MGGLKPWSKVLEAKLFEYFEDARAIYVVTELCTGGNIGELDAQVKNGLGMIGDLGFLGGLGWEYEFFFCTQCFLVSSLKGLE